VIHAETSRGDDEHTAFYALFVVNLRLRLLERLRSLRDAHWSSLTADGSPPANLIFRAAARWATVRKVINAIAVPARPVGLALDRLGLGSEILVVARAGVRALEVRP
jgi:hypothetical protein